jgi:hypothetical protein
MKSSSTSQSSFNALAKKRRINIALSVHELKQRQRRRIDTDLPSSSSTSKPSNSSTHTVDSAIIELMKRHCIGVAVDEFNLNQLLKTPTKDQTEDDSTSYFDELGTSLIQHPLAVDALMHALYIPGGRMKSSTIKAKCAKLIAMAVIASEKKLIQTLDDEDKNEAWVQKLQNQGSPDIDTIANVSCL